MSPRAKRAPAPDATPRAPDGWSVAPVNLTRADRTRLEGRSGFVHPEAPGLAVSSTIGADRVLGPYVATHVGSGLRLFIFGSREDACGGVLAIAPLADWTASATKLGKLKLYDRCLEALRAGDVVGIRGS